MKNENWEYWFAWKPTRACGRWHFLAYIFRRWKNKKWEYKAGLDHDYTDSEVSSPMHFYIYTCRFCHDKFEI